MASQGEEKVARFGGKCRPLLKCGGVWFGVLGLVFFFLSSRFFLVLSIYFSFCVEGRKFVYENLVSKEPPFPLECSGLRTKTRQREGLFSFKAVSLVFVKANPIFSLTK